MTEQNKKESNSDVSIKSVIVESFKKNIRQYTMFLALIAIMIIFSFLTRSIFLSVRNLSNLFLQSATVSIIAMGMVLIIVAGHIDLSVGSYVGFVGAIVGALQVRGDFGVLPAIILALVVGLAIGCWQGFWVAYRGVPAFIVTLAGSLVLRGGTLGVTQGQTQAPLPEDFLVLGQKYLLQLGLFKNDSSLFLAVTVILLFIVMYVKRRRSRIKYGFEVLPLKVQVLKILGISVLIGVVFSILIRYLGIPYAILLVMIIAVSLHFVANNTVFGRQIYALGGNKEAARLSGINIKRRTFVLFVLMGFLTSVAALVFTSRVGGATAAAGQMMELDAIAAAVIGGTSLTGGVGTIAGAIVGALVMTSLDNGMSLMNLDVTFQYVVKGLILLLAVWIDIASRKLKED
jgi:D-xylose transport system permease protein